MNEVPSLVAELWYAEAPDLNAPALLDALRQLSGDTEQQDGSLVVPHPGSGSADQPLLTVVMAGSPLGTDGKQRPDTSQTWDWAETEAAVATGQASVLITELFPGDVPAETRVGGAGPGGAIGGRRDRSGGDQLAAESAGHRPGPAG